MENTALNTQDVHFGITGYFDAQTVSRLQEDFHALVNDTQGRIVLDLTDVDFLDSSGIGSIVFLYKRLKAQGRDLQLEGVNGQPARLIEALRVNKSISTEFLNKGDA